MYENLRTKIHMVGLDVTRKIVLTPNILEYMQILDTEKGEFIKNITRFYYDFHWEYERVIGCVINDPLAVAYFLNRELCRGFEAYTTVEFLENQSRRSEQSCSRLWLRRRRKMKKLTVVQVCFIALSAVINIIGGNLALVLRLPIYLDSIGTFLASALLGPVGGVLAGVVSLSLIHI